MLAAVTRLLPMLLLAACAPDTDPGWAVDELWLEPDGDGVHGFQTWEIYGEAWSRRLAERHYLCAVVVELWGDPVEPGDDCGGCSPAWAVEVALVETDCDPELSERARWLDLSGVALGPLGLELADDPPWPGMTRGGYAAYGDTGWLAHGWAYPAGLDSDLPVTEPSWNGQQSFTLVPAWAWELSP